MMLHYFDGLLSVRWLPFAAAFLFLLCGALRLARFNISHAGGPVEEGDFPREKDDFFGLPIPVAAAALASYVVFTERVWDSSREPHAAISLMAMLAFLMVSSFDYPAFPRFTFETPRDRFRLGLALGAVLLVVLWTEEAFFPVTMAFCLSGAVRWLVGLVTRREVADIS